MTSPAKKAKGEPLKVVVVGGGNSTPIFAALAKDAGYHVTIMTRKPAEWSKNVGFENEDPGYLDGAKELRRDVDLITDDPAKCIPDAFMIFLAGVPIHHNESILKNIRPHLNKDKPVYIGSICAYGGFNWVATRALGPGKYILFGERASEQMKAIQRN